MRCLVSILLLFNLGALQARVHTETIEYRSGDAVLEGYLAYDDSLKGPRPGILIVHEWTGLGAYVKERAEQIARLGYIGFAIDIYGKGIRPDNSKEAGIQAGIYRADRQLYWNWRVAALTLLGS